MSINFTNISSMNTTVELVQVINREFVDGWFGVVILAVIFLIFYINFEHKTGQPIKSLTAAAFISFGLSIFLVAMNILPIMAVFICLAGTALGAAFWNLD